MSIQIIKNNFELCMSISRPGRIRKVYNLNNTVCNLLKDYKYNRMYDCTSREIISLSKWVSYVFSHSKFLFFDVFRFNEPSIKEEQDTTLYILNWYIWIATMQMKSMKLIIPWILYWITWGNVNRHLQILIQVVTRDVYCIRRSSKALS